MKPTVVAAAAFATGSIALGAWLLSRPRPSPPEDAASRGAEPSVDLLAFATWSARSDAILFVEADTSTTRSVTPRRFHILDVSFGPTGEASTHDGAYFSWAPEERAKTTRALLDRGFPMTTEDPPYPPARDPLSGEAPRAPIGSSQVVSMRSPGGLTAILRRRKEDPRGTMVWNKRALGFPSMDQRYAYVVPDEVVIPIERGGAP